MTRGDLGRGLVVATVASLLGGGALLPGAAGHLGGASLPGGSGPGHPLAVARLAAQEAPPVQLEAGTLPVGGGTLHYETAGEGEALLFLHDGLTYGAVWDTAFASFARDHRVVRFDRRGHGRSVAPVAPYSPVEDIAAVLDAAGVERATLVGASSGGGLALAFALAHPERVSALVLVGALVPGYGYSDHFTSRGFRNTAPLLDGRPKKALANWVEDRWIVAPGNKRARKRLRDLLQPWFEKHMAQRPDLERLPEPNLLSRLPEIGAPTLVLVGEVDIPDVHAHAGALETSIPDARRAVVSEAGHLLFLERPEEFERLVRAFLVGR